MFLRFLVTMFTGVLIGGKYSAFSVVTSASTNLPFLANKSGSLFLMMFTWVLIVGVLSAYCTFTSAFSNLPFLVKTSSNLRSFYQRLECLLA
jgi:hypothetical protein